LAEAFHMCAVIIISERRTHQQASLSATCSMQKADPPRACRCAWPRRACLVAAEARARGAAPCARFDCQSARARCDTACAQRWRQDSALGGSLRFEMRFSRACACLTNASRACAL
jgi:hypothetical protein